MRTYLRKVVIVMSFAWGILNSLSYGEEFNLISYYPIPSGVYEQVRLTPRNLLSDPCEIGSLYVPNTDNLLRFCSRGCRGPVCSDGIWQTIAKERLGDLDLDGAINVTDVDIILGLAVGISVKDIRGNKIPLDTWRADISGNGSISAFDSALLLQYLTGGKPDSPENRLGYFYSRSGSAQPLWVEGDMLVSKRIGIGSTSYPTNAIDVYGSVVIGESYYSSAGPISNSLIVEGKVGLGTSSTHAALTVGGAILREGSNIYAELSSIPTHINLGINSTIGVIATDSLCSVIGGGEDNFVGTSNSTIGGGKSNQTSAYGIYNTVGGGLNNSATAPDQGSSVVIGGRQNENDGDFSIIGGGYGNFITGLVVASIPPPSPVRHASIAGGTNNIIDAKAEYSTIGGGNSNNISGLSSVILGGESNIVEGDYSWAGGKNMWLTDTAHRTFVWGYANVPVSISASDAFIIYSGNVGIGVINPGYQLQISSPVAMKPGGGNWTATSDRRLKKDITPIKSALDNLLKLRGISYEWKEPRKHGNLTEPQIGMIAQEAEKVFPEWVGTDQDGYKDLGIRGFEALTVEAIRELKSELDVIKIETKEISQKLKDFLPR